MDKQYYKEYFEIERNHWWFKARSKILQNYVRGRIYADRPLTILNVGVATGATSVMLQDFGAVSSLEYEQECIEAIKGKVPIDVIQGSILALPYDDSSFDLVCAFDVIEHVDDHQLGVNEMKRVCRPGGAILVTVPASMALWGEHDEINHHFRRYSARLIKEVFEGGGRVVFSSYFNFFLFPPILLLRTLANAFRGKEKKTLKSDFEKYKPGTVSNFLFLLMKSESFFLTRSIRFPWGVSALLHWRKNG